MEVCPTPDGSSREWWVLQNMALHRLGNGKYAEAGKMNCETQEAKMRVSRGAG